MDQPIRRLRWLGLIAAGASLGFVVVPVIVFTMGVLREASPDCYSCPPIPLADGMWFALFFSLVGIVASLRITPESKDAPVFVAAGGIGLLVTGSVMMVGGMASPHGEAVMWALSGTALVGAAVAVFSSRIRGHRSAAEQQRKS
jgi:thiosulfate reductase cytochrome b subunit